MTKKNNCKKCQNGEKSSEKSSEENELLDFETNHIFVPPIFVEREQNSVQLFQIDQHNEIYPPIFVETRANFENCIDCEKNQNHYVNENDSQNCENTHVTESYEFVFGLLNVKRMEIIPSAPSEFVLQINYCDFLCPLSIVDQNDKTNQDIPFLISLDCFIYQLQKRKNTTMVTQAYVDNCCFHFIFKVKEVCYIPGYQVILFVKLLCGQTENHLIKIFKKKPCHNKLVATNICISYHIPQGRISFPKFKSDNSQRKLKKK